ncbi:hypothetical protein D7X74_07335 [Corallococcus sp. CA047B]|uniref:hypothetical protein n=1 Tax=Corallococcus sp. CA047B TaxID=2316729 RepID=UPI000EA261D2|nr:hypothetical protein [Corallococcus sp. CA047B]RKH19223.1 hypothetical protein D7X74_07335 [Corallococcus sp. CA047B]
MSRIKAAVCGVALVMGALSGCGDPALEPVVTEAAHEAAVKLHLAQEDLIAGGPLALRVEVASPVATTATVELSAPESLALERRTLTVDLAAGETKSVWVRGHAPRAGFFSVTAVARADAWGRPTSHLLGLNAHRPGETVLAPVTQTLTEHLSGVPRVHSAEELARLDAEDVRAAARGGGQDTSPRTVMLDGVTFPRGDGTRSAPVSTVMTVLPDTGSGAPSRVDLEAASRVAPSGEVQAKGLGCNANGDAASVHVGLSYQGRWQDVRNTRVTVYDENPALPNTQVATGYTDASGWFHFRKPTCDYGAPWDMSLADLFFVVETEDLYSMGVYYILTPYSGTHSVRTGTFWDTSGTTFSVNLAASNSPAEQALGVLNLIQHAEEFNAYAGGTGGSYFSLRVAWPTHVPFTSVSFATVSKLELVEQDWADPFTVWHEFGHELMYFTTSPVSWYSAYELGALAITFPSFAYGSHFGTEQQHPELAYNEGWASYFGALLAQWHGYPVGGNLRNFATTITGCNGAGCTYGDAGTVWANGNENEMRVSTFLYRYNVEVLQAAYGLGPRGAFGRMRERLFYVGRYDVDIHEAWEWWLRPTMPPGWEWKVSQIASDTFMDTGRIP